MNNSRVLPPFEPTVGTALSDLAANETAIRDWGTARLGEWRAIRVQNHWTGASSVAVMKPQGENVDEIFVTDEHGVAQEWAAGPGMVAVLLRSRSTKLLVSHGSAIETLEIEDLDG